MRKLVLRLVLTEAAQLLSDRLGIGLDRIRLPDITFRIPAKRRRRGRRHMGESSNSARLPATQVRLTWVGRMLAFSLSAAREVSIQDFCSRRDADSSGLASGRLENQC